MSLLTNGMKYAIFGSISNSRSIAGMKNLVAKDVEFEVKDTGEVQHVTMVDEEKPAEKTPEGGKPVSDSPKTGDNTNLWLWFMLLGIGATGTGALAFMRKKKH